MRQNRIKLEICCGTTCYMLGAAELLKMEEILPADWRSLIDFSAMSCLEICNSNGIGSAPYVRINGKVISNATVEIVLDELRQLVEKIRGGETK